MAEKLNVEIIGGPRDGEFVDINPVSTQVRFPNVRGGLDAYDVAKRSGKTVLAWEGVKVD